MNSVILSWSEVEATGDHQAFRCVWSELLPAKHGGSEDSGLWILGRVEKSFMFF